MLLFNVQHKVYPFICLTCPPLLWSMNISLESSQTVSELNQCTKVITDFHQTYFYCVKSTYSFIITADKSFHPVCPWWTLKAHQCLQTASRFRGIITCTGPWRHCSRRLHLEASYDPWGAPVFPALRWQALSPGPSDSPKPQLMLHSWSTSNSVTFGWKTSPRIRTMCCTKRSEYLGECVMGPTVLLGT